MLALLVAACFALAWLLRLGWIADYFSRPVLVGYIHGVAVILVIGQLGKLLGLSIDARDPLPQLWEVVRELGSVSGATVAPRRGRARDPARAAAASCRGCPAALLVVVAAIGVSWALDLQAHGVAVRRPDSRGTAELRPAHARASADVVHLVPAAVGIFLVAFADEILTARSFAGKHNQHVRASQELLALGAANAAAGVHPGLLDRRKRLAHGGQRQHGRAQPDRRPRRCRAPCVVILLFLTEPVQYLPKAVLGAVIVSAAIGLVDLHAWRALAAVDHVEVAIAGVTTGCVVVFGVLEALAVAVGLSVIDTVRRSARPHDAVLGWVDRLGRYADVSLHPSATRDARRRRLPARRPALLRQRPLLQGAGARGDPRRRRRPCRGSSSTRRRSRMWTRPGSRRSRS